MDKERVIIVDDALSEEAKLESLGRRELSDFLTRRLCKSWNNVLTILEAIFPHKKGDRESDNAIKFSRLRKVILDMHNDALKELKVEIRNYRIIKVYEIAEVHNFSFNGNGKERKNEQSEETRTGD